MDFEKQYRIFIISFILGIAFYIFGDAITSFTGIQDFLVKLIFKGLIYLAIFLLSLFFLGGLSFLDIHLITAHLVLMIVFAVYGIFLTVDNLSMNLSSKCLVCHLPIKIPYYIWIFRTRHFIILVSVIAALIWDIKDLADLKLGRILFRT
ncbi:MAG TPA: hypothetical protein EYP30_03375 [Archaeoglobaceae archaeon]|nr:hypothetical protein [Archaeoglobaceae archaeon]